MAFLKANLAPIGGQSSRGKAPQVWSYQSAVDNLAAVKASGYFDEVNGLLEAGDIILFVDVGGAADVITLAAITAGVVTTEATDINSA